MIFQMVLLSVVLFLTLYTHVSTGLLLFFCLLLCGLMLLLRYLHRHEHTAFLSIDSRAHRSKLNHWNAGLKILLAVFCVLVCISASTVAVPLYLLLSMSILTVWGGKTPLAYYLSLLTAPVVFILLSCLAILVEFSPQPFGVLSFPVGSWYLCIPQENQMAALKVMLRSIGAVSCLYMLSLSTPIYQVVAALRVAKVSSVMIELMYLIYRYLFILLEIHQNMVYAAASRLGYRNYRTSIKTMLKNALNLLFISFRQTSNMLSAMEARCYDGEIRFLHDTYRADRKQIISSVALIGGMIFVWIWTQRMVS